MYNFFEARNWFERALKKELFKKSPQELYDPINYLLSLEAKRLRPALVLMAYNVFDDEIEKALKPAIGIELFHNFTLMHDDIMDNAPLRRGEMTVHEKFDTNAAIILSLIHI